MLRFAVFALLVAAASADVSARGAKNPFAGILGPVEGITPCGSKGTVKEIRVTDCTTLPCKLVVGSTYKIEVDFSPAVSHETLSVLVDAIQAGEVIPIVTDTIPANVEPGRDYTLAYDWTVKGDLPDGRHVLRIKLEGVTAGELIVELCGMATVELSR